MFERKVAIMGWAMSDQADRIEDSREGMVYATVRAALDHAGITREQLETVVSCSNDFYDGHTISQCFTIEPSAAYAKDETKVEQDGLHALLYAAMRLASGNYDLALVVAHVDVKGEDLSQPRIIGMVKLEGGGKNTLPIYGEIKGVAPDQVKIGMKLAAVWAAEPKGEVSDLSHFQPVAK